MSEVGKLLRSKRKEKRATLKTIANHVGVSINYISKMEKGESIPSDDIIVKLALALDLDEYDLFTAFGKMPLSTRKLLEANPQLSKQISQLVLSSKKLSAEKEGIFMGLVENELKKLTEK
jgi:transcriptional regulator with XRE-family HTH domain